MERLLTAKQMREADDYTINKLGIPHEVLVERAGVAVAGEIDKRFMGGRVLVCIGKGNNGEDGKIIAKILSKKHGFSVATLNVESNMLKLLDKKYDIIVDCIFGTGLNREVTGKYKEVIEKINESSAYVVSCDIASGLNADNGKPMGVCVKANLTVAIQELKLGQFLNDGVDYSGEVVAKDIGISIWEEGIAHRLCDSDVAHYFPTRPRNVNKGNFGKACVFGGCDEYPGSVVLAYNALSAMKMGSGYSALAVPKSLVNICLSVCPECIVNAVVNDGNDYDYEKVEKLLNNNAISIGMGMGVSQRNYKVITYFLQNYTGKLVIDADGLNTIAKYGVKVLENKKCQVIITPHIKEFSRLTGLSKDEIIENSIEQAKAFANKYKITVLLKNAVSVITDGDNVFVNTTGNGGMAKAGSGDVLSGIITGLLARGLTVMEGAIVGAYLFGKAGDFALEEQTEYTLTASNVINALPKVLKSI